MRAATWFAVFSVLSLIAFLVWVSQHPADPRAQMMTGAGLLLLAAAAAALALALFVKSMKRRGR